MAAIYKHHHNKIQNNNNVNNKSASQQKNVYKNGEKASSANTDKYLNGVVLLSFFIVLYCHNKKSILASRCVSFKLLFCISVPHIWSYTQKSMYSRYELNTNAQINIMKIEYLSQKQLSAWEAKYSEWKWNFFLL